MHDDTLVRLFALFTSLDRAEAIAGDLTEERGRHGSAWFWLHTLRTTFALCRHAVADAPLHVLALVLTGLVCFIAPAFGGAVAVAVFPQSVNSPISWIAWSLFWWGGALWTGFTVVAIAPGRGMAACTILAGAGTVLLIALGLTPQGSDLWNPDRAVYYLIALGAGVPLMIGGALARQRTLANGLPLVGPGR